MIVLGTVLPVAVEEVRARVQLATATEIVLGTVDVELDGQVVVVVR